MLFTVGATGCANTLPAPMHPTAENLQRGRPHEAAGMDDTAEQPMTLYPGDIITVRTVSNETNLYEGLVVDETGRIHLPLGGDVVVGGLALAAAEHEIEQTLHNFDRFARATITITSPAGHHITVLGAVTTPGQVAIPPGARISDIIALAGGPLSNVDERGQQVYLADFGAARLFRDGAPLPVSIERALQGDPRHDIRVRSGDHLFIPPLRGDGIAVLGRVGAPTEVHYRAGLRLTQALALAGGTTLESDEGDVRILRGPLDHLTVYEADLLDIVDGDDHDVELAPGDVVFVTEEWTATVGEVLDRVFGAALGVAGIGLSSAVLIQAGDSASGN